MAEIFRYSGSRDFGSTVEFEDATVFIEYPTSNTWRADIVIEPDITEYDYRFLRVDGVYSPWFTVTVDPKVQTPRSAAASNTLDFWGNRLDTPRNPNEDNSDYQTRLLDVFVHKGGPTHTGLLNAIARDLNLTYNDQALVINTNNAQDTGFRYDSVQIGISSTKIRVWTPEFIIINEEAYVQPVNRTVIPSEVIAGNLTVKRLDGSPIDYDYDELLNRIYLKENIDEPYILLSYLYMEVIDRIGKTLAEIETELEAITTPAGDTLLSVEVYTGYESYLADYLQLLPDTTINPTHLDLAEEEVTGLPIRWTDMRIEVVWDPELSKSLENWTGSLWNTKVDHAYLSLVSLGKQFWGTAVADESIWGDGKYPLHGGQNIKTIYDPALGYWENPLTGEKFDRWQASNIMDPITGDLLVYKGLTRDLIVSGVGHENDLKIVLDTESGNLSTQEEDIHKIALYSEEADIPQDDPVEGIVELP